MATTAATKKTTTLTEALIEFQKELPKAAKDSTNPHFRNKYLSLGGLTDAALPVLTKHGFAYTTTSSVTEAGLLVLEAHLKHESGDALTAQFPIQATDPQKVGSAISYYRRYGLASLTGIVADEDDDGNAASLPTQAEQRVQAARATPQPKATSPQAGNATVQDARGKVKADYIDTGLFTGPEVNEVMDAKKGTGLEGEALWNAVGVALAAKQKAKGGTA